MVRLTLDGASKCDLRDFLLEEWVAIRKVSGEILTEVTHVHAIQNSRIHENRDITHTGVDFGHLGGWVR